MFQSDRKFKLWDYRVSHNQALIRSPRTTDIPTNVDLVFWGVEYMSIPSKFDGIVMNKGGSGVLAAFIPSSNGDVFTIETEGNSYVVVAAGCKVLENGLDIFESSLEGFAATDENRDLGNVLAHS